jgi:hypothetical protein
MKRDQPRPLQPRPSSARVLAAALFVALLSPAAAQDVSGLEICTAEKQMERRTGCLQANAEFLQQVQAVMMRTERPANRFLAFTPINPRVKRQQSVICAPKSAMSGKRHNGRIAQARQHTPATRQTLYLYDSGGSGPAVVIIR